MTDDREHGLELGDLRDQLGGHEYPASKDELLEAYGDTEIAMEDETTTVEALLEPLNEDEYRSADEVEQAVVSMVGEEAIGRKQYSDRTPPAPGEDGQSEPSTDGDAERQQESF